MEQQRHEMVLENTHSSGAEEWYCPTCGRRMAITWQPWKKIVLEQGDVFAAHTGSKGGLQMGHLQVTQGNENVLSSSSEPSVEDRFLAPWMRWLDKVNLDDLGNEEI
jgi:hypothetical protein